MGTSSLGTARLRKALAVPAEGHSPARGLRAPEGLHAPKGLRAHPPGVPGARGDTAECVPQVLSGIKVSPCRWCAFNLRLNEAPDLAVSPSLDGRRELRTGALSLPAG